MAKGRMAGKLLDALGWLFKGQDGAEIAFRVIPDVGFGVLEGAMTPGDIGDKLIAGTSTAVGGLGGGIALGKLGGNGRLGTALDMAGSLGGDFAGRAVGEQVQKGKDKLMGGKGQSAYERFNEEQMAMIREQAKQELMVQLGIGVG